MRVFNQAAYILLNRPYSETSWVVEVFSRDYGRIALMAKGARRLKSRLKGVLQPFQPVILSWTGKGEVPTMTSAEVNSSDFDLLNHQLRGDSLVCGFYCNELLVNLLHRHDPHPNLFDAYHDTIIKLASQQYSTATHPEPKPTVAEILRGFEQRLMKETGYEIDFLTEADGKTLIRDAGHYRFHPNQGFVAVSGPQSGAILGVVIKSLHGVGDVVSDEEIASQGKRLMREILQQTLGYKKIVSRDLFFPR